MVDRFWKMPLKGAWVGRLAALFILGFVGVALLGATGCDTVAVISFSERRFERIQTSGITATQTSCDAPGADQKLRFVLMANDATPIKPGEAVALQEVNLTSDQLEFTGGRIFSTPDVKCEASADCGTSFSCAPPSGGDTSLNRCQSATELQFPNQPEFLGDLTSNQLFGVLYVNAGSAFGYHPQDVGVLHPWNGVNEETGQNLTGSTETAPLRSALATDEPGRRYSALANIVASWSTAARNAKIRSPNRISRFGFWQAGGSQVLSVVNENSPPGTDRYWTGNPDEARSIVEGANRVVSDVRANVYEAIVETIEQGYAEPGESAFDKTLVVYVDNPNLRISPAYDFDRVLDTAVTHGVKLFIVHLDPKLGDPSKMRDDYRYYELQSPCMGDGDCPNNYEECRQPQRFAAQTGGPVVHPSNFETNPDAMYCLPKRDENGRIGPVADYSRLACETEGGYLYVTSNRALVNRMGWLPHAMEGLWEVRLRVSEVSQGTMPVDEAYKLQGSFTVDIGGDSKSYNFGQLGETRGSGVDDAERDTRTVFYVAE